MANLSGLVWADPVSQAESAALDARYFSAAELRAFGLDQHAGYGERRRKTLPLVLHRDGRT